MATLYIEEYQSLSDDARGRTIPASGSLVTHQVVTSLTSSPQNSASFHANTTYIMITADVAIQYEIAASPTASSTTSYLPADVPRPFAVPARGIHKISVRTQA